MDQSIGVAEKAKRQAFYDRIAPLGVTPLWEALRNLMPHEPQPKAAAHIWRYQAIRPALLEAGGLLTAEEAERRVLILENPSYPGESRATASLYAGLQLVLPGETAPAHRHTPSALRMVVEGQNGYTAVGGERTTMHEGDMIITPAWAWHDHGNEGDQPVIWLDGLDIPMLGYFEAVFNQGYNDKRQMIARPEGDSLARYGNGLLPHNAASLYGATSPIFNYPYERTRESLVRAAAGREPDPCEATTLRYANPLDGGWAMPTLATWMTHVGRGMTTVPIRSTDSMIMHVVEGEGTLTLGEETFLFAPKDTIAIPGWRWRSIAARSDVFAFFCSDRVVHEKLSFWREERRGDA